MRITPSGAGGARYTLPRPLQHAGVSWMSTAHTHPVPISPPQGPGNDRDAVLPLTLRQLLIRWLMRGGIAALLISLVVHAIGWQVAARVGVGGEYTPGAGPESDGGLIEMAVLSEAELDALDGADIDVSTPSVPDAPIAVDTPEISIDSGIDEDAGGSTSGDIGDVGDVGGGGDIKSGPDGVGLGGGGGGGGASFFGVEAVGNRFAYVVDVSGSMDEFRMAALLRELKRSIDGLLETSEFMIVKYSTEAAIVGDVQGWREASPNSKRAVRAAIDLLTPEAQTLPVPGFNIVFAHRPRPDAIYFMTDGDFSDEDADAIIAMYRTFKAPVHGICLGYEGGEQRMRRIARATKGTYTFVRVNK